MRLLIVWTHYESLITYKKETLFKRERVKVTHHRAILI